MSNDSIDMRAHDIRVHAHTSGGTVPWRKGTFLLAVAVTFAAAATAAAHDFWLVPNAFEIAPGGFVDVRGQTSSLFPTSESAVTTDRVVDALLLSARTSTRIDDLSVVGKSLRLRVKPEAAGQYVIAALLNWRSMRESAGSFREYLRLEGASSALERIDRLGLLAGRDSVTRRYAKYAKTFVQVGRAGSRAFNRSAGHPLEFVPERDPSGLRNGDTLAVRLIFRGQPAAGARVHAGAVEWTGTGVPEQPRQAAKDMELIADASGIIRMPVTAPGLWNVRTIHITQSPAGVGADWDAHWATLVFLVDVSPSSTPRGRD